MPPPPPIPMLKSGVDIDIFQKLERDSKYANINIEIRGAGGGFFFYRPRYNTVRYNFKLCSSSMLKICQT